MRTSTRLLVGLAAAGAVAAAGSAFTAGTTLTVDNVAGYGQATVTGATASSIKHNLSTNGQSILTTVLVFDSAIKNTAAVKAGFDPTATSTQTTCQPATTPSATQFTCTWSPAVATSSASVFTVSVS